MVLVARVAAEAVGVRQPPVVVGEGRRQCIHELERDAELARGEVRDAGASAPLVTYAVNVTNTGSVPADDVVLGFLTPPNAGKGGAPLKQLFGFERVHVLPGQTVSVYLYPRLADFVQVQADGTRKALAGEYTASFGVEESAALGMGFARHAFTAV